MTRTHDAENTVRSILRQAYGEQAGQGQEAFIRAGMYTAELVRLYDLLRQQGCRSAVEVGMACGTSSVVISKALADNGGGALVSIDPFQNKSYSGKGVEALRAVGFDTSHRLIEQPDYLGLPQLVAEGHRCDFVFIDGWHSFDYTLVDLFYADLLLKDRGVVAIHDTVMPCVQKACHFVEKHKPYKRLSAPVMERIDSLAGRSWRRLTTVLSGPEAMRGAKSRREEWFALAAYQKLASEQAPEDHPVKF